jgi:hypothetical protein
VSNLSDLITAVGDSNTKATNEIGASLGLAADISGAVGLVTSVISLLEGDSTQAALQNILTTIQKDFAQLMAAEQVGRIISKLQNLDTITSPAQTQLEQLQANQPVDITKCLDAINNLALNPDALGANWQAVFTDQIFWTDSGQYMQVGEGVLPGIGILGNMPMDAGYGPQTPPQAGADSVFTYRYVLPDFLRTLAIFVLRPGFETSGCACLGGQG